MKPEIISKLEKDFDIEIVQLKEHSKWENSFDVDEQNNIKSLHLRDVEIGTLDFIIPYAHSLSELSITRAHFENVEILKAFTELEYLNLNFNPILTKSLSHLNDLRKLKELHLRCTNITDTSPLGGIVDLEKLFLGGSDVLDQVNGLEDLTNLNQLEINLTEIRSFENVHVSDSLRFLSAESTIDKISGLERFPNLEELYLGSNCFEKLEGLEPLVLLKRLNLFDSGISEIQGLENLTTLEILDLGANEISVIKGLSNLNKLKKLSLGFNKLSKVNNLEGLTQLEYLLLDGNYITEFDGKFLSDLTEECTISLCHNPIKGIDDTIPNNVSIEFESIYAVYRTLF